MAVRTEGRGDNPTGAIALEGEDSTRAAQVSVETEKVPPRPHRRRYIPKKDLSELAPSSRDLAMVSCLGGVIGRVTDYAFGIRPTGLSPYRWDYR